MFKTAWTPVGAEPTGAAALDALVKRRLPQSYVWDLFKFVIGKPESTEEGYDSFHVVVKDKQVTITSATTPGLSRGLLTYLRTLGGDIYWSGDTFSEAMVDNIGDTELTGSCWVELRYFLNIVAHSYTTAWYDFDKWEYLLDWAALHGITMPLAVGGQEYIWLEVLADFGLSEEEILAYLPGGAFKAWFYMGNTHGSWGQKVTRDFVERQWALQQKIVARMLALGMTPVLPGFSGFVPRALQSKIGGPTFINASRWNDFEDAYSYNTALEPTWDSWKTMQTAFLTKQQELYGGWTLHHYSVDLYNEMHPSTTDPAYMRANSSAVMQSLKAVDPQAVWVMQAWCLRNNPEDWPPEAVEGFLKGVSDDEMLILDLASEHMPFWNRSSNYYGKRWVWNTLHYGQNNGLFGSLKIYNRRLNDAKRDGGRLVGIGITSEGLNQNEIVYEMALDAPWSSTELDIDEWTHSFIRRRYTFATDHALLPGEKASQSAWNRLVYSVYNSQDETVSGVPRSIFDLVPAPENLLDKPGHWLGTKIVYDTNDVVLALDDMLAAVKAAPGLADVPAFRYDLVDVARQALLDAGVPMYLSLIEAWRAGDAAAVKAHGQAIVQLLRDVDAVVATDKNFLLSTWIQDARSWSDNDEEKALLERDARNQLLLWGTGSVTPWPLDRYACKHWHGMVADVYAAGWEKFYLHLLDTPPHQFDYVAWAGRVEKFEMEWEREDGCLVERLDQDTPAWNPEYDTTVKISSIQTYNADWWHRFNPNMPNVNHVPFHGYTPFYGYLEVRAKLSNVGGGGHQAVWLVGINDTSPASRNPEIDFIETFFSKPTTWRIAGYGWGAIDFLKSWVLYQDPVPSGNPTEEFHLYAMDWRPNRLDFYYDNKLYKTISQAPQQPMGIIVGTYTDAGSGVHNDVWPKTWHLDYIRVWKDNKGYR